MAETETETDMQDICTFCAEVGTAPGANLFYEIGISAPGSRDYILEETPSFVVVPCIGALVDTYVLVISKRHVLSTGWLTAVERTELRQVLAHWSGRIANSGVSPVIFEHGSYNFRDKGGACYDHCHAHVLGTDRSPATFVEQVREDIPLAASDDWLSSAQSAIEVGGHSYLAVSSEGGDYIGNSASAPSQFFRRHLARWLEADEGVWDWLVFPEVTRVKKMIAQLA
jgi:hypothetical protein